MPNHFQTTAEAAEFLSVTTDKITDLIHSGQLAAVNVALHPGGKPRWRIADEALKQFITSRQSQPVSISTPRRKRQPESVTQYH
jgi:excisionase family DNA binding protein